MHLFRELQFAPIFLRRSRWIDAFRLETLRPFSQQLEPLHLHFSQLTRARFPNPVSSRTRHMN